MPEYCPMHTEEPITGVRDAESGDYEYTCTETTGHGRPGAYSWVQEPERRDLTAIPGLAKQLRLDVDLPAIIANFGGDWIEFGVLEEAFAAARPEAFKALVDRYGHTAIAPTRYSASVFLSNQVLSRLARRGDVSLRFDSATGRWSRLQQVSWWSTSVPGDWEDRISWESTGKSMDYVPGNTEKA